MLKAIYKLGSITRLTYFLQKKPSQNWDGFTIKQFISN